jgi:hypothetical protein
MTAVCRAKGFGLAFGDFKSSVDTINGKVPDIVCIDTNDGHLRIVGEVKTLWVIGHDLESILNEGEDALRHILGEPDETLSSGFRLIIC